MRRGAGRRLKTCGEAVENYFPARASHKDEGPPRYHWRAPLDDAPVCQGALVVSAR